MLQTVLYVFGPFMLYTGAGIGLICAAQAWVRKVVVPRYQLSRAELDRYDEMVAHVEATRQLLTDLVLEVDSSAELDDSLSRGTKSRLYQLNESARALPVQRPASRRKYHA